MLAEESGASAEPDLVARIPRNFSRDANCLLQAPWRRTAGDAALAGLTVVVLLLRARPRSGGFVVAVGKLLPLRWDEGRWSDDGKAAVARTVEEELWRSNEARCCRCKSIIVEAQSARRERQTERQRKREKRWSLDRKNKKKRLQDLWWRGVVEQGVECRTGNGEAFRDVSNRWRERERERGGGGGRKRNLALVLDRHLEANWRD